MAFSFVKSASSRVPEEFSEIILSSEKKRKGEGNPSSFYTAKMNPQTAVSFLVAFGIKIFPVAHLIGFKVTFSIVNATRERNFSEVLNEESLKDIHLSNSIRMGGILCYPDDQDKLSPQSWKRFILS